jgi:hypothetical protein
MTANNAANLQNNNTSNTTNPLSFKDVNKKIGFKRNANEMLSVSSSLPKEIESKNNGKKAKK